MEDAKYQTLIKEVRGMRQEISRMDRDLGLDRHDMGDFRVEMEALKAEVKQLRADFSSNAKRVGDKVSDAMQPAVDSVDSLKKEMKKKQTIIIFKNGFWDFFKNKMIGGEIKK